MGNGYRHYSSGCYYITSMEDNISADGYTQTCKMIKNIGSLEPTVVSTSYRVNYTYDSTTNKETNIQLQTITTYSNGSEITTYTPVSYDDYTWYKSEWYNSQGQLRQRPASLLAERLNVKEE